ncbi:hypothetical protein DYB32_001746 [Aphanomyces invadans]|nr:hypothetical protein DYB32_001746 [Aphanomyces invadans]
MSTRRNWGDAEHEYCLLLMELFKEGCLPLKQGMHLRQTLAMLLNCNPMRITKKFKQQDTLGKQTYVYHPTPNGANYKRHVQRQKQITTLRDAFYWQLKLHSGQPMEAMREAETEFWIKHLVGFGAMIGQAMSSTIVVPSTPPTPTPMHWEQQPHETAMDVGSAMTIDCTIGLYEPCMSQMEWEVVEELKAQDVDPLPWSGHSLHDEFGDSNDITMGSFFMDRITVDDSIWQC